MEISQGRKRQRALSPPHELLRLPNGSDHQGQASSCGLLGPKTLVPSLPAGLSQEGSDQKGREGHGQSVRSGLGPLTQVSWEQSRGLWTLQGKVLEGFSEDVMSDLGFAA